MLLFFAIQFKSIKRLYKQIESNSIFQFMNMASFGFYLLFYQEKKTFLMKKIFFVVILSLIKFRNLIK